MLSNNRAHILTSIRGVISLGFAVKNDYQNKTEVSGTTQPDEAMRALLSFFPTDLDAEAEHGGSNQISESSRGR